MSSLREFALSETPSSLTSELLCLPLTQRLPSATLYPVTSLPSYLSRCQGLGQPGQCLSCFLLHPQNPAWHLAPYRGSGSQCLSFLIVKGTT